ncbi:ABC transporter ATP-binding protein [Phycisphaera mikurensis]|uniref:Putative ABC transporter permease/ATP-binding protein n=1 Tax=Phycisphaera mikurensis (strain NBRC 102666 / KCTC 22515 / FYK2301M01) TaxID=1142394 RepID=I0IC02_PHYMF|nr:ABC transporter ATP-binding protein [Phycisphaera mikurensis]MBB6441986.1 subfamily B ATP-binding cassette protein MsbA [Phycisphaera mikurensis]BAM02790.1 putative ABC transporter permease/ATP-binding protein [Phycisphaera mikurensis NBRC 102666]
MLLRFKRLLVLLVAGALLSAASFGAGLGMLFPVMQLLLNPQTDLRPTLRDAAQRGPGWLQGPANGVIDLLPGTPFTQFVSLLGVIVLFTIVGSIGRYLQTASVQDVTIYAEQWWRKRLFRRAIRVPLPRLHSDAAVKRERKRWGPPAGLEKGPTGGVSDLIARLTGDVTQMCAGYPILLGRTFEALLQGAVGVAVAFIMNWRLSLVALIVAPLLGFIIVLSGKRIRVSTRRELSYRGSVLRTLTQAFTALATVKTHNAEGVERRRFQNVQRRVLRERLKVRRIKAASSPLMDTLALIGVVLTASVAAWWVFNRGVQPEELVVVLGALVAAGSKLKPLANLTNELQAAAAAADRVIALDEELPAEPTDWPGRRGLPPAPAGSLSVAFEGVVHRYPNADRDAVAGVDLHVPAGHRVAIVGGNGSGKTTLVNHLPRLLEPTRGRILLGGVDVASLDLKSLRERIAVVSQKTALFGGTIAENIAYGRGHAAREDVVDAAKRAFAHDFIDRLPDGYDAVLGEGGVGLSGGQGQRISIARAILRDAPVLILDEATSQVDADSELKIKLAMDRLAEGRTTLLIAHRLSTVVDADEIVVMDDGRIVDRGTHEELLGASEIYRRLVDAQLV